MSFASDVKAELCRAKLARRCCAQAEACGVLLYCNRFSPGAVKIVTESQPFAQRLPTLFYRAFGLAFDERGDPDSPKQVFTITDPRKLAQLWELCAFDPAGPAHHINFGMLEATHCRQAFLRGAFLAGGSVTDPQKGYHLELSTTHRSVSRELTALLLELGYAPKQVTRKESYHITYFKQSEAVEDLLTAIGAPVCAMQLMNAKAEKLLRNGVNRRVNCEAANVDKTVDAAMEQRQAIQALRQAGVLDELTPKLREAARLREAHPELSLSQLAGLCEPPVTKSSLSHRLRKLIELSKNRT